MPCWNDSAWWLGILLAGSIGAVGMLATVLPWTQRLGLSALTASIILGMVAGNTFFPSIAAHAASGVDFSRNQLLRAGIILYGFRISFQQITDIGWAGLTIDLLIVSMTFWLAVQLGTRVFKIDRQMAMLIGAGASICGAAAVMAAEPIVKGSANKVSVAVASVVLFGTLGMFAYPLLYPYLGLSEHAFGVYAGSTIHEVAQVVVAAKSISEDAAATAVIVKMLRVMMLAPFLIVLSLLLSNSIGHEVNDRSRKPSITIPWFAVLFIVASAVNSLHVFSPPVIDALIFIDNGLLATAMAALGIRTHTGAIRQAGSKPLLLAATLFAFLVIGGYMLNRLVMYFLASA